MYKIWGMLLLDAPFSYLFFLGDMKEGRTPPFSLGKRGEGAQRGMRVLMVKRVGREELIITWGGLVWI